MLKTRIIPVLLLKGNSIVKTVKFKEPRIVGDAVATVKVFATRKADEMIIVDIEATKRGSLNIDLIERISKSCNMPLSIGGGIQSVEDADALFRVGADKVIINSKFYSDKNIIKEISRKYGEQAVVFSLDVRRSEGGTKAFSNSASVNSDIMAIDAAKEAIANGAGEIYLNSIDQDGCMQGYDLELIEEISSQVTVPVVAAGGCGDKEHCVEVIKAGADAVAAASIFFWIGESIITIKEHLKSNGIEVRLK
jgi:imidazole glycerol-phosphate synthase subunit HisF